MSYIDKEILADAPFSFFSLDDWVFIKTISDRFPERVPSIYNRFQMLLACPKDKREGVALEMLKYEPRQGLVQRGYAPQNVASIYDHTRNMARLLGRLKKENQGLKDLFPKNSARKFLCHDFGEAATTDFTPQDMARVSPAEKIKIEDLAMKVIFEHSPERYQAYISYKEKATEYDRLIKVVDILELLEDIEKMGVSSSISEEIQASSDAILKKYPDIMQIVMLRPEV